MTPKLKEVQAFFELLNKHFVEYEDLKIWMK